MNEDTLNMEVRTFLKKVGVTSQREIEHTILKTVEEGRLQGIEKINVRMTLEAPEVGLNKTINGVIAPE